METYLCRITDSGALTVWHGDAGLLNPRLDFVVDLVTRGIVVDDGYYLLCQPARNRLNGIGFTVKHGGKYVATGLKGLMDATADTPNLTTWPPR